MYHVYTGFRTQDREQNTSKMTDNQLTAFQHGLGCFMIDTDFIGAVRVEELTMAPTRDLLQLLLKQDMYDVPCLLAAEGYLGFLVDGGGNRLCS